MAATGGINKNNAFIAGSTKDAVYLAPVGTPLPTTIDGELNPAFEHVGWIHADGVTETPTGSKAEIRGHQGQGVVRTRIETPGTQLSFTALESKPQTKALRYDEKSSDVTGNVRKTVRGPGQRVSSRAMVVDKWDADFEDRHERDVYATVDITPNGDRVYTGTDVAGFPMLCDIIGNSEHYETYTAPDAAPSLTSVAPTSGASGTTVTLTGTDFLGSTQVRFGSANATSFTVVSNTSITAVVPAGAAGSAAVKVVKGSLESSTVAFTRS